MADFSALFAKEKTPQPKKTYTSGQNSLPVPPFYHFPISFPPSPYATGYLPQEQRPSTILLIQNSKFKISPLPNLLPILFSVNTGPPQCLLIQNSKFKIQNSFRSDVTGFSG